MNFLLEFLRHNSMVNDRLIEVCAGFTDDQLPATVDGTQAVDHGTEHGSQIATILTQSGIEPPPMDAWTSYFEAGQMVEV